MKLVFVSCFGNSCYKCSMLLYIVKEKNKHAASLLKCMEEEVSKECVYVRKEEDEETLRK